MDRRLHLVLLGLLWVPLFAALAPTWQDGTYYSYGWLVPPAMALFFFRRREDAPPFPGGVPGGRFRPGAAGALLAGGLFFLLALRIVEGGNVHWRLPLWIHGAAVATLSLAVLLWAEGSARARHFAPVVLFAAIAFPLPSAPETALVQTLSEAVVETGAGIAGLLGMPVEAAGLAFLVDGKPIDVNDGCSGIRSFQSSLMAALFMGELLRLPGPARVTLVLAGVAAAFAANAVRVVTLIAAFLEAGHEGVDRRHDFAGLVALGLTYGIVIGVAYLLDRTAPGAIPPSMPVPGLTPGTPRRESGIQSRRPMTGLFLIGIVALLGIEGFRAWWFFGVDADQWETSPRLRLATDRMERETLLKSLPVDEYVDTGGLRFDRAWFLQSEAESGFRPDEDKEPPSGDLPKTPLPSALFLEYEAGNEAIWNDLFTHPPEVCMRSSGCTFDGVLPSRFAEIGGLSVPIRCLQYREPVSGAPLFIFKMVWLPEESPIQPGTEKPENRPLWIRMALTRLQTPPGAVLLARVRQAPDFETAWRIVEDEMLPYLVSEEQ